MDKTERRVHPYAPIYDKNSKLLILGTMPSPASLSDGFYYGHPRNRFWKVMAALTGSELPTTKEEKSGLLLHHGIALWDVLQSCDIVGADDNSIANPVANDIPALLRETGITKVYANGTTAEKLYQKLVFKDKGIPIVRLPSTSPANAALMLEKLIDKWREMIKSMR